MAQTPETAETKKVLIELPKEKWPQLRDIYLINRCIANGYDLIDNFIKWSQTDATADIKMYVLDDQWPSDGLYLLIHKYSGKIEIYFNTLQISLTRLKDALRCLSIPEPHLFCGYPPRLKTAIVDYYLQSGRRLEDLQQHGVYWYHLDRKKIDKIGSISPPAGLRVGELEEKHAQKINDNWQYFTEGSVEYVKFLIQSNISVGIFDGNDDLIAWCLRSPHGSLGLLQVMESYKRRGVGSFIVRYMAKKIYITGAEVLATVVFSNTESRVMFENLGFTSIGQIYWGVIPVLPEIPRQ